MNDVQYLTEYSDGAGYKGPVIKAGAGVQVSELYKFASGRGVVVVAAGGQASDRIRTGNSVLTSTDCGLHRRLYPGRWSFAP